MRKLVASKYKTDEENVVMFGNVYRYGGGQQTIRTLVYDSLAKLK